MMERAMERNNQNQGEMMAAQREDEETAQESEDDEDGVDAGKLE